MLSNNSKTKLRLTPKLGLVPKLNMVALSATSMLLVLLGAFIIESNVKLDDSSNSANAVSESKQISVNLNETINISSYPATIELTNCNPSTSNLCTANASITTSSNYELGYSLYMNATNGSPTALTNTATSPSSTIPSVTQAYSSANLPVNTWGYTGGTNKSSETGGYDCTTNYCPILAYNSNDDSYAPNRLIDSTDTATASRTKTITFGAKVNTTKPSGTYTTTVVFTAVGTPKPTPTMQTFSPSDCASVTTDQTFTLEDSRDGTDYTVAKLRDGNCWMTQNLELGQTGQSLALTSADSNVSSSGFNLTPGDSTYKGNSNKYGNFYSYYQATAGTDPSSGDSQYDICPKNWRLPSASTSNTNSEFYKMLNPYITTGSWSSDHWSSVTTSNFTNAPVSLVFSGWNDYGLEEQGSTGYWWSSTARDANFAYLSYVSSGGSVYPRDYDVTGNEYSIRCLVSGS